MFQDIDLADLDRFTAGFPYAWFERLRRDAPVWFHPPTPQAPGGEGFWVVSRHEDMLRVARDPAAYSSEGGGGRAGGGTTLEDLPRGAAPGVFLHNMDPPRHDRFRSLIHQGFKPRTIARLEQDLRGRARRILDAVAGKPECDFVVEVAAELPLQAIAGLLGARQEDRRQLFRWANVIVDYADRNVGEPSPALAEASAGLAAYARELIAEKRERPGDDMLSVVVHERLPGSGAGPDRLTEPELVGFFFLLIVAGSETTRNAIANGLYSLVRHPDQLALLRGKRSVPAAAVEEILRFSDPVSYNRRTATRDVELRGHAIRAGDKVTLWWPSANRDDAIFPDPYRFDLRRTPNPHLAFGHGVHFCLGANLARMEIRLLLEELLARFSRIELAGEPEWTRSNKHHGMRHLPVRLTE